MKLKHLLETEARAARAELTYRLPPPPKAEAYIVLERYNSVAGLPRRAFGPFTSIAAAQVFIAGRQDDDKAEYLYTPMTLLEGQ
jgi:hypothetical protein